MLGGNASKRKSQSEPATQETNCYFKWLITRKRSVGKTNQLCRAYISIDARVVQQTSSFVPTKQVIDRLDRGVVIGASRTDGTKAGTIALQATDEPYKTIDGMDVPCAFAKAKVDNMRFFARKFETVTVKDDSGSPHFYVHYRIDGMRPGH